MLLKVTSSLVVFVSLVMINACTVLPKIELTKITGPDRVSGLVGDEIDTYSVQRSVITIDSDGQSQSIPREFTDVKFGLRRADSVGIKTSINIAKIENTGMPKEISVETIDDRAKLIEKAGAIIKDVILASQATLTLPLTIDTLAILIKEGINRSGKDDVNVSGVSITFGPLAPDAVALDELKLPAVTNSLPYASCRSAIVKFDFNKKNYEQYLMISDPRYFQRVSLPIKGKISFHSSCGVSIVSDKETGVASTAEIGELFVKQAKEIKEAIEASKKK